MRRALAAADLYRYGRVGAPAPAPDGRFAIVPVTTFDLAANRGVDVLWLVEPGREARALTAPERGSARDPAPSPDGRRVAFVRETTPGGKPQVNLLDLAGGEPRVLTDLPLGARDPRWLADGKRMVLLGEVLRDAPTLEGTRQLLAARAAGKATARVTEDVVYRYWDRWLVDGEVPHLWLLDAETRDLRDLTPGSERWMDLMDPAGAFDIAPDAGEVAFAADLGRARHEPSRAAIFLVSIEGGEVRCLTPDNPADDLRPRYSPDGRWLAYGTRRDPEFYADRVRIVLVDRRSGETTLITEGWDRSPSAWEWTADARALVLEAEDEGRVHLFRVPVEGGIPERIANGGAARAPRPVRDGRIWHKRESLLAPAEVFRIAPGAEPEPITRFQAGVLAEIDPGTVEEIRVPGAEGAPVQAWIVRPPGLDPSRPAPLVHMIHGGPHGAFHDEYHWRWNAQAFAAPGYVVCLVNFHGSTGFGQAYAEAIHGAWGDKPAADVLAVTDHLIASGVADPARMAITGGSYGGYLTAWLTARTDRFRCAIVHAGVFDLSAKWACDVTHRLRKSVGGVPWEDAAAIDRWSPASHTAGMKTPTLVIHGERDYRVQATQGLHLYGVLRARGIPARLVYYPDENHWIQKPHNALHWYGEVHGWLARWLRPL